MVGTLSDAVMELAFGLSHYTDLLRLCTGVSMLVYGSYSDVKTREVSDVVWIILGVSGVFFVCIELFTNSLSYFQLFKSLIAGAISAFLLYILNFGGADVKAIISLSLLFPSYPIPSIFHLRLPLMGLPPVEIFVLTMLTNALIIAISAPLAIFLYNLFRRNLSPFMFLGWKVKISDLRRRRNYRLMHDIEEVSGKGKYVWGGIEPTEEILSSLEELEREKKIEEVWITPELPFILYLTAGFFIAVFYGDLISAFFF
ncbi:MAG: A24 family peptidase [Candidatus Methanospirareceae archaeon]